MNIRQIYKWIKLESLLCAVACIRFLQDFWYWCTKKGQRSNENQGLGLRPSATLGLTRGLISTLETSFKTSFKTSQNQRHIHNFQWSFNEHHLLSPEMVKRIESLPDAYGTYVHHIAPHIPNCSSHYILFPGYKQHTFYQYRQLLLALNRDHHVWIIDYPGHNSSQGPLGEIHLSLEQLDYLKLTMQFIASKIDHRHDPQVHIVSYSFGTLVVSHFYKDFRTIFADIWKQWFVMACTPGSVFEIMWNSLKCTVPLLAKLTRSELWNTCQHPVLYKENPFISRRMPPSSGTLRLSHHLLESAKTQLSNLNLTNDDLRIVWIHGEDDTIYPFEHLLQFHQNAKLDHVIYMIPKTSHTLWSGEVDSTSQFIIDIICKPC